MESYTDINAETIDCWVAEGWPWGIPIDHECYERARQGLWDVVLTPTKAVPKDWFGDLRGAEVLGLCSGGGQQMPIFAAAGAHVAVIDYSSAQIANDVAVAEREGYPIEAVRGDVTRGLPFDDGRFDLVFNPVSICYIRDVRPLWQEAYRVLKPGGVLVTGFDTIVNYIVDTDEEHIVWHLPFDPVVQEDARRFLEADDGGMQFSHDLTDTIGAIIRTGFVLEDLYEDTNGEGRLFEFNIPTYVALKARKPLRG